MPATEVERSGVIAGPAQGSRRRPAAIVSALKAAARWKASIGFALFDQGMTSFANFAQFAIAARVLPIDELGLYSIAWVSSMFVVSAAAALVVDPLPAITSVRRPAVRKHLLAASVQLSLFIGCGLAALMTIVGMMASVWSPAFGILLLCLAVTSPLQQLQYASRRLCYLVRREDIAAASAAAYAAVLLGGVVAMWTTALCSAPRFILLSGAASFVASGVGVVAGCVPISRARAPVWKWLVKQCWHSGRWLAGSSVIGSMSNFLLLWITAVIFGPSATGILRAVTTLFMPVYQLASATGSLVIPRVADVGASRSARRLRIAALQTMAGMGACATAYSAIILVLGSGLFVLVYNKPELSGVSGMLWPFSACAILDAVTAAIMFVLIGNGITRVTFWGRLASTALTSTAALCLGPAIGLDAIVWAAAAGSGAATCIHGFALVRFLQRRSYGDNAGTFVEAPIASLLGEERG